MLSQYVQYFPFSSKQSGGGRLQMNASLLYHQTSLGRKAMSTSPLPTAVWIPTLIWSAIYKQPEQLNQILQLSFIHLLLQTLHGIYCINLCCLNKYKAREVVEVLLQWFNSLNARIHDAMITVWLKGTWLIFYADDQQIQTHQIFTLYLKASVTVYTCKGC